MPGDVIILDNDVAVKTGAVYALDQFNTVAYNNQNGTANWAGNWTEVGDNATASSGDILITSNRLQFQEATTTIPSIYREVSIPVNGGVTVSSFARLIFTVGYNAVEFDGSDEFRVDVSDDGGATWSTVSTFGTSAAPATSQSFDIGANLPTTGNPACASTRSTHLRLGSTGMSMTCGSSGATTATPPRSSSTAATRWA